MLAAACSSVSFPYPQESTSGAARKAASGEARRRQADNLEVLRRRYESCPYFGKNNCRGTGGLYPNPSVTASCSKWEMMAVPKTGSSFLAALLKFSDCCGKIRYNFHNSLYKPCSLATLREPCERVLSSYAHLRTVYPTHWPGLAKTADEFVIQLEAHWSQISSHNVKATSGHQHHLILAVPQYWYIGNGTRVICTERLDEELPDVFRSLGCCRVAHTSHVHNSSKRIATTAVSHRLNASQSHLSSAACATVRRLYWQDHHLYQSLCTRPRTGERETGRLSTE